MEYSCLFVKRLLLICTWMCCLSSLRAQNTEWANQIGGTGIFPNYYPFVEGKAVTTDLSGNVYATGVFGTTTDVDPGPDVVLFTANQTPGSFGTDILVTKSDAAGNFLWGKHIAGNNVSQSYAITTDNAGSVYITGYFCGTADFNPAISGIYNLTVNSAWGKNAFILKLDAAGNFLWAKQLASSTGDNEAYAITHDNNGNIYVTGKFQNTADFDPGAGVMNLTAAGSNDIFILKMDGNGNTIWAKNLGGSGADIARAVATDNTGNVYTSGTFSGTADFDPGPGTVNLMATGSADAFISKLDAQGIFVWARSIGGTGEEQANALTLEGNGNSYITGIFTGTVDFDPGPGVANLTVSNTWGTPDIYLLKLNAAGQYQWAKRIAGSGYANVSSGIAADASGYIYTTGNFGGTTDFNPGAAASHTAAGEHDIFITKHDTSGNFVWVVPVGGSASDRSNNIWLDGPGNIYTTGWFQDTVDFSLSGLPYSKVAGGSHDMFVHKIDQSCRSHTFIAISSCDSFLLGQTYDQSGLYTLTLTNAANCDSIVHLDLTIKHSSRDTLNITTCDSTTINGVTYTASGSYTQLFSNAAGCDSLLVINAILYPGQVTEINATECDSFVWNNMVYKESGTYLQYYNSVQGCDSDIVLQCTINKRPETEVTQTGNILTANLTYIGQQQTYQWLYCSGNGYSNINGATQQSYIATAQGGYAVVVTEQGCTDTSGCIFVSATAIQEARQKNFLVAWPNPSSGQLNMASGFVFTKGSMRLWNTSGSVLIEKDNLKGNRFFLDISSIAAGSYLLELREGVRVSRLHIVKH